MIELSFTKMHGLGNCFILMDDRDGSIGGNENGLSELAKSVCDRNFGIGADGLILLRNCDNADFGMRIINEDGSEAEMCGNGIRCLAKFVFDKGMMPGDHDGSKGDRAKPVSPILRVDTLGGIIETRLLDDGRVEVDMGEPILSNDDVNVAGSAPLVIEEEGLDFTFVSMGNPHAVAFVENFDWDWRETGAKVEIVSHFPNRTNVEFVKVVSPREAIMKVWERGCGETMACGTGACAVAVAGALRGRLQREPVTIRLPGGPLDIHWNGDNRVMMVGPAVTVCDGVFRFDAGST